MVQHVLKFTSDPTDALDLGQPKSEFGLNVSWKVQRLASALQQSFNLNILTFKTVTETFPYSSF